MPWYLGLVALSVALFVWWGGALWTVPPGSSHLGRFAVSYLAGPPLAALLLLALRRFTWSRVWTATALVWAVKLLVTASLYYAIVGGRVRRPEAATPSPSPGARLSGEYRPASTPFAAGAIRGRVLRGSVAVAGAVVHLVEPPPGAPLAGPASVALSIRGLRHEVGVAVVRAKDALAFANHDAVLHTIHLHGEGRVLPNRPLPPNGATVPVAVPPPGLYRIRCDAHEAEAAALLVLDHPYATTTAADGAFHLDELPAGTMEVRAVALLGGFSEPARATARVALAPGGAAEVVIALAIPTEETTTP